MKVKHGPRDGRDWGRKLVAEAAADPQTQISDSASHSSLPSYPTFPCIYLYIFGYMYMRVLCMHISDQKKKLDRLLVEARLKSERSGKAPAA